MQSGMTMDVTASLPRHFSSTAMSLQRRFSYKMIQEMSKSLRRPLKAVNPRSFIDIELFPWQSYLVAGQAVIFSRA